VYPSVQLGIPSSYGRQFQEITIHSLTFSLFFHRIATAQENTRMFLESPVAAKLPLRSDIFCY